MILKNRNVRVPAMLFAQRWPWPGRAEPCPCQIVLCSPPAASCGPSTQYTVIKNLNVGTSRKCKKAKILPDRLQALARRLLPVAAAAESRRPTRQKNSLDVMFILLTG